MNGRLLMLIVAMLPRIASSAPGDTELESTTLDGTGADGLMTGISPDAR
jgi:hypothetical protein